MKCHNNYYRQVRPKESKQHQNSTSCVPPPKPKDDIETVTVSRDYLEKLLRGVLASKMSVDPLPITDGTSGNILTLPQIKSTGTPDRRSHTVFEHSQVPGLTDLHHSEFRQPKINTSSQNILPTTPSSDFVNSSFESPLRKEETYHRGTINRPVHRAMRSQIVFGEGPAWGSFDEKQATEEAKRKWMSELGKMF